MSKYILIIVGVLILGGSILYFSIPKYKHEECTIKVLGVKGELYEKMEKECKKLNILDKDGNLVEVIKN